MKVCGVRDAAALDAAAEAGADWIGLVFFERSPRCVDAGAAAALHHRLGGRIPVVGLFVDPGDEDVARVLAAVPLDILQIYGPADRALSLRRRFGLPVWLSLGIAAAGELPTATVVDGLVVEARPPADSDRPGGNGIRLDWPMLKGWSAPSPWLLAGGLTTNSVAMAVQVSGAAAVDVSSGVERAPGEKDPALIRAFVAAAKVA